MSPVNHKAKLSSYKASEFNAFYFARGWHLIFSETVKTERSGNESAEHCSPIYEFNQIGVPVATIANYYKMKSNTDRRIAKKIRRENGGTVESHRNIVKTINRFMPTDQTCDLFNSTKFVKICINILGKCIIILEFAIIVLLRNHLFVH